MLDNRTNYWSLGARCSGAFLLLGLLGGCAYLPNSGPTASEITKGETSLDNQIGFHIQTITQPLIDAIDARPAPITPLPIGDISTFPDRIGPGDVLQISIFEVGTTLFNGNSAGGGAAASTSMLTPPAAGSENLPIVAVERDGTVTLPYVGKVQASGHTATELAQLVREALKKRSQDPQVLISIKENFANTTVVIGDVKKPGRIPLKLSGERLLDVIAESGGPSNAPEDELVRVTRNKTVMTIRLSELHADVAANALLYPDDRIELVYQPRTYTIFGATGKVSEVPFTSPSVSLAAALARTGGPSDQQADPTAVFVFRYERCETSSPCPVIYRLNLLKPQSYFLALRFDMRPADLIYIANADANLPTKLIQVLNLAFQPFYTAKVISQR